MSDGATPSGIDDLLRRHHDALTPAERRVAAAIVDDPDAVAFGTVAALAGRAATGGATVLRLAAKLELDGFSALQRLVRDDLRHRLRPAAQRIRDARSGDTVDRVLVTELDNLTDTFDRIDRTRFDQAVIALTRVDSSVAIVAGATSAGVAQQFADELAALRPGVVHLRGSDVATVASAAALETGSGLVAIDVHRYDQVVLDVVDLVADRIGALVTVTDGPLSPLARRTDLAFTVAAGGAGPFDSKVAVLAVLQALAAGAAAALVDTATERLDAAEQAWNHLGLLRER